MKNRQSCVYAIKNLITGKLYVGSTRTKGKRWGAHQRHLRKEKHHSSRLQTAWNEYGSECFVYGVIEYCSIKELKEREQIWLDHYESYQSENGYNMANNSKSPMAGRTHTKKAKQLIGKSSKLRWQNQPHPMIGTTRSEECKRKIRSTKRLQKLNDPENFNSQRRGKFHTEEAKRKMSKAQLSWLENNDPVMLGFKHTEKSKKKMSRTKKKYYEDHEPWNKGVPMTEEVKKKVSESLKGREISDYCKKRLSESHRGEGNPSVKLTESEVLQILTIYNSNENPLSQQNLGKIYKVTQAQIFYIVKGKSWKHVYDKFHDERERRAIQGAAREKLFHEMCTQGKKSYKGEENPSAKLDEMKVHQILAIYNSDGNFLNQPALAKKFNVSVSQINSIVNGNSWKHVYENFHKDREILNEQ